MKKITLCGSTRFKQAFIDWNKRLSLEGNVVYSVSCFMHAGDTITDEQKILLDKVHKEKIMASDMIFVLDIGGYIGESTFSEIKFAEEDNKEIRFLSIMDPYYVMPDDPMKKYEKLLAGCDQLINCNHQEHLITRMNDEETAGIEMIKHAMSLIKK